MILSYILFAVIMTIMWAIVLKWLYWSDGTHIRRIVPHENKDRVDLLVEKVWREKPVQTFWGDVIICSRKKWIKNVKPEDLQ